MENKPPETLESYEEEAVPFDDVMRRLLQAKPRHKETTETKKPAKREAKKQ